VDYDFSDPAMKKVMIYTPDNVSNAVMDEKQQPEKNNRPLLPCSSIKPQLSSVASQWKWTPPLSW
jgi:hypothetical protein